MGWTVKIESESGRSVEHDFDIGFDAIPHGPEYPICSSVAHYFVTLLNPPQLKLFVQEWDKAASTPQFAKLKDSAILREIAERCARHQRYIRFIGD